MDFAILIAINLGATCSIASMTLCRLSVISEILCD
jgi:hypothetical protein